MHKWFIVMALLLLTGCIEQNRIEKLGMSDSIGIDPVYDQAGKPSKTELAIAVSIPKAGTTETTPADILRTNARTPKDGRVHLNRKINKVLVTGQLRSMMFAKDLAKQGVFDRLDTYRRDYTVGEKLKIALVNGSAVELLTHKNTSNQSIGVRIDQLLTEEARIHEVPDVTLYSFVRDYYDDGIDPVAPMLALVNGNLEVDGIALFQNDRYIGRIDIDDAVLFALLSKSIKQGEIRLELTDRSTKSQESAVISSLISKRKIKVYTRPDGAPNIVIQIRLSAIILEYTGMSTLKKPQEQATICLEISEALRKKLQVMVTDIQRHGGDNLGIGTYVRNRLSYEAWKALDWPSVYPQTDIHVEVVTTIRDFGMIR
ncbi:Ger(x)C family spore germination protein [Bacillus sp. 3255]|uniref:Ger(x)C family spore germination protein n=1 Tax=Bacillus sp. 3255 TaxID=2817904 RepID=UPI0028673646|nr:Ger(x)C family spore germination protein [Bacillus sp. 3255]MDR6882627.1 spore germination protein [Bacillus sp. 3255]